MSRPTSTASVAPGKKRRPTLAGGFSVGPVLHPVSRGDQVQGAGMSEKVVWQLFQQYAAAVGVPGIAPSRKRGCVGRSRWPH